MAIKLAQTLLCKAHNFLLAVNFMALQVVAPLPPQTLGN